MTFDTSKVSETELPSELLKMLDFLPEKFADKTEEEYIKALVLAAQTSYQNGLYQFAYVQYHMLFMTAIYYILLKTSHFHKKEFENALYYLLKSQLSEFEKESNKKNGEIYFGSFAFIKESDVFILLRVVGLTNDLLGDLQKLVQERNKYAHANGQLQLTSDELLIEAFSKYNAKIQQVADLLKLDLISFYKKTISEPDFYDPDIRAYSDADEQIIQEFIKKFSISKIELNWLHKIRLDDFSNCENAEEIKTLHKSLINYYKNLS